MHFRDLFNLRTESKISEHAQISELLCIFTAWPPSNTGPPNCIPSIVEIAFKSNIVFQARILKDYPLISLKNRQGTSKVYMLAFSNHLVVFSLDGNFLLAC